jgi:hypothetical protein
MIMIVSRYGEGIVPKYERSGRLLVDPMPFEYWASPSRLDCQFSYTCPEADRFYDSLVQSLRCSSAVHLTP